MIDKSQGIDAQVPEPPGEKREVVMATRAESVGEPGRWARQEQTAMCCLGPGPRGPAGAEDSVWVLTHRPRNSPVGASGAKTPAPVLLAARPGG